MTAAAAYSAEQIASVCHEANRALQFIHGDPAPSPPWEDAPEWQRSTAVAGVAAALAGATPDELHEAWRNAKERDGWRHGRIKSAAARTHPCLVPYDKLPAEQRDKDRVFAAIVAVLTRKEPA